MAAGRRSDRTACGSCRRPSRTTDGRDRHGVKCRRLSSEGGDNYDSDRDDSSRRSRAARFGHEFIEAGRQCNRPDAGRWRRNRWENAGTAQGGSAEDESSGAAVGGCQSEYDAYLDRTGKYSGKGPRTTTSTVCHQKRLIRSQMSLLILRGNVKTPCLMAGERSHSHSVALSLSSPPKT